jgi:Mg2+ and Co2+ transporter CorA
MAIRALLFDAEGQDREVEPGSTDVAGLGERQLLWVGAQGEQPAELDALIRQVGIQGQMAQSLVELDRRPRVDLFGDTVAIVVTTLTEKADTESTGTLQPRSGPTRS